MEIVTSGKVELWFGRYKLEEWCKTKTSKVIDISLVIWPKKSKKAPESQTQNLSDFGLHGSASQSALKYPMSVEESEKEGVKKV